MSLSEKAIIDLQFKLSSEQMGHIYAYRRMVRGYGAEHLKEELVKYPDTPVTLKNIAKALFMGHDGFNEYAYKELHRQAALKEIEFREANGGLAIEPWQRQRPRPSPAPC